ncbi:MAG: hypothetical protein DHS20C08_10370 [Rhodomicrobium sp.]|nr:MAG: hypothetical protein DHS20C08_10370 [Rhodomicrobium sp.]
MPSLTSENKKRRHGKTCGTTKAANGSFAALTIMFVSALFVASSLISSSTAEAKRYNSSGYDRIKIVSRFSPNKYIIAPVRPGRYGDRQVRLPNGRWIDCARNCRWTVQKEYLDFWEFQQNPFGPGYLRLNIR